MSINHHLLPFAFLSPILLSASVAYATPQDFTAINNVGSPDPDLTYLSCPGSVGTVIGQVPIPNLFNPLVDLSRSPSGLLYAVEGRSGMGYRFYWIDEAAVGGAPGMEVNMLYDVSSSAQGLAGMAISPSGDSAFIFGTTPGLLIPPEMLTTYLVEIDLQTGVETSHGAIVGHFRGLAFDASGDLYSTNIMSGVATLVRIDQVDAANSFIYPTPLSLTAGLNSILSLCSDRGAGAIYAMNSTGGGAPLEVLEIDTALGTSTATGCSLAGNALNGFAAGGGPTGSGDFCFGDGGDGAGCTDCPCNNDAGSGSLGGCLNSVGSSARLLQSGDPVVSADTLRFEVTGAAPTTFAILVSGNNQLPAMSACPVGSGILSPALDGLRCMGGAALRHGTRPTDSAGDIGVTNNGWGPPNGPPGGLIASSAFSVGQTRHFQCFYREDVASGCMTGQNTTQGVSVTFQ